MSLIGMMLTSAKRLARRVGRKTSPRNPVTTAKAAERSVRKLPSVYARQSRDELAL